MRQQVIDRLLNEFGPMRNPTRKLGRWQPRVDVGIAVELEGAKSPKVAYVWTPHPGPAVLLPVGAEEYGQGEGRHSNTYALPGLRKGMAALRHRVETLADIDALVRFIGGLPPIRSAP